MLAISVAEMRALEEKAINQYSIPSVLLMENAAMGFVSALKKEFGDVKGRRILVVCGKGNNAGDGFAIARLLHFSGAEVEIFSFSDPDTFSGDLKVNAVAARKIEIPVLRDFADIKDINEKYDIIVDAIFGTGFHGVVTTPHKEVIEKINLSEAFIASVDVPSGVDLGENPESSFSVQADLCVTFGYAKLRQLTGYAAGTFKKMIVAPISIPCPENFASVINEEAFALLPERKPISHKGTFGKVLALTGSFGMAGAAVLSGGAVLRSGAGMLTLAVCDDIIPAIVHELPSAMTLPLSQNPDLSEKGKSMDALLIGCGLGTSDSTKANLLALLSCEKPTVIDADGLNIISENPDMIKNKNVILTPHIAEFSRLCGARVHEIKANPVKYLKDFCTKYGVCVVLKDAVTVICDNGRLCLCHAPNSGMATAGSGDVLAGIIASFLAQGLSPFDSATAGVYIHSAAGSLARESFGEAGMTSADILNFVPRALMKKTDIAPHIKEL